MRHETRPTKTTPHAEQRMRKRHITRQEADAVIRTGGWTRYGIDPYGNDEWRATGSIDGRTIKVGFVETQDDKTGEDILLITTVID